MRRLLVALALVAACRPRTTEPNPGATVDAGSPPAKRAGASSVATLVTTPDPACTTNGCLRAVTHVGDYERAAIAAQLAPGVTIDNGYSIDTLRLWTSGRETLATVAVPLGDPPKGGYHVVANDHGTTGLDDPCAVVGTIAGAGLAGLFGARGMIGVAVEYPGLGTSGLHPYLVAESEGHAVLDVLRATRSFAAHKKVPISGKFAATGMSQGGHATLSAAALSTPYAPDVDLRAVAVAAPASGFEEHWRAGIAFDGAHVPYHAMLIYAWTDHYAFSGPSPFVSPKIDAAMKETCAWSPAGSTDTLHTRLGTSASAVFSPAFLSAYRTGVWGPYAAFHDAFDKNRLRPWKQHQKVKIYQGDADVFVPEVATRQLVEALRAGGVTLEYEVVPLGTHLDVAFGFVAAKELRTRESIDWIRNALD